MPPTAAPADLSMPHLRQAREEVQAAFATPAPEAPALDPRARRDWTFEFSHTDGHGKVWNGRFTNHVLSLGQRIQVGVVRGRRQAGVPIECMAPRTLELLYIVGWMEESLIKRPDWAQDLLNLTDEDLVEALWDKVAGHESTFRGRGAPAPAGQDQPAAAS